MVMEALNLVFSSFWVWAGTLLLVAVIFEGIIKSARAIRGRAK